MARPRKRAFGEVDQLPSKNYRARYTYGVARYSAPVTFSTAEAAEAWLLNEHKLIEAGTWAPPAEREQARRRAVERARYNTFGAYLEEFFGSRSLRPGTEQEYRRVLDKKILPTFRDSPLSSITRDDVRQWFAKQPKGTPSANAAAYRILRSVLNSAADDELIDHAPRGIKRASRAKPKREAILATLDQLTTIADTVPDHLRMAVVLAYTTGVRQGELLELRRTDVDTKTGTLKVTRAVGKTRNQTAPGACKSCGRVIGEPKTEAGKRVVTIPASVLPDLRAHVLAHAAKGSRGLLFPGATHDHTDVATLQWHFKKACRVAGVPQLRWHELRHAALSLAGAENATTSQLMHRAGHSSRAAMEIYQHSDLEQDRQIAERLNATLVAYRAAQAAQS